MYTLAGLRSSHSLGKAGKVALLNLLPRLEHPSLSTHPRWPKSELLRHGYYFTAI